MLGDVGGGAHAGGASRTVENCEFFDHAGVVADESGQELVEEVLEGPCDTHLFPKYVFRRVSTVLKSQLGLWESRVLKSTGVETEKTTKK